MTIHSILKKTDPSVAEAKNKQVLTKPRVKLEDGAELEMDTAEEGEVERKLDEDDGVVHGEEQAEVEEEEEARDDVSSDSGVGGGDEGDAVLSRDIAPVPGSIADREHRKWVENAVQLSNNPYSQENIERRLSNSKTSDQEKGSDFEQEASVRLQAEPSPTPVSVPRLEAKDDIASKVETPIDFGVHTTDFNMYKRDYYINDSEDESVKSPASTVRKSSKWRGSPLTRIRDTDSESERMSEVDMVVNNKRESPSKTMTSSVIEAGEGQPARQKGHLASSQPTGGPPAGGQSKVNGEHRARSNGHTDGIQGEENFSSDTPHDSLEFKPSIKVSEEIQKFQKEIKRREQESRRYNMWKEERAISVRSNSMDNLLDENLDMSLKPSLPPRNEFKSQEILNPPRPPKKKAVQKRVSYAKDEVIVYASGSEDGWSKEEHNVRSLDQSRQILPSSHLAPTLQPPPAQSANGDDDEEAPTTPEEDYDDEDDAVDRDEPDGADGGGPEEEDDDHPVLPSVRELKDKFQAKKNPTVSLATKKVIKPKIEKIPDMLKTSASSYKYHQVHSLTARSVSREFRENLKAGKPIVTDTIVKLPDHNKTSREVIQYNDSNNNNQNNIVYNSSKPKDLYPEGKYIRNNQTESRERSESPEHSGIPAKQHSYNPRPGEQDTGYTSDDSNNGNHFHSRQSPSRGKSPGFNKNPNKVINENAKYRQASGGNHSSSRDRQRSVSSTRSDRSGRASSSSNKSNPTQRKEWTVWT